MKLGRSPVNLGNISPEDPFLAHHLPGSGGASMELRRRITTLNSSYNDGLLRVILITGESGSGKNHVAEVVAAHKRWLLDSGSADTSPDVPLKTYSDSLGQVT